MIPSDRPTRRPTRQRLGSSHARRPGRGAGVSGPLSTCSSIGLLLALAAAAPAAGGVVAESSEFQVNSTTNLVQRQAAVAAAPDGRYVIAWASATSPGNDTSLDSIQAQQFDANGSPFGGQIQVNTYVTGTQWRPAVAMAANGNWVVAWESESAPPGDDASLQSIRMRGFTATGAELFAERQVNDFTTGAQVRPALAWIGGEIVAAWQSSFSPGNDSSQDSIQVRRFSTTGVALAPQLQVNTTTSGPQTAPAIAGYPGLGYAIAWGSDDDPSGTVLFRVRARRLDDTGPLGGEILVDGAPGNAGEPSIAMSPSGLLAIAWQSTVADAEGLGLLGRLFSSAGVALGPAFPVDNFMAHDETVPEVAFLPSADLAIAWQSEDSPGPDVSTRSIQLRIFDGMGQPRGGQEQVNIFAANAQETPAVAVAANVGRLIVAWESNGSNGSDHSLLSIQAATYLDTTPHSLLSDGFETGSTCRWSGPC